MARKPTKSRALTPVSAPFLPDVYTIADTVIKPDQVFTDNGRKPKGPGPWREEADKIAWQDSDTGLHCIILRLRDGSLSGYVAVPASHSLYGFNHDAIRPGEFFQGALWQSLCDSDVLVMLDTPSYFKSKWTIEEFGKARSSEISILRLVWPGHSPVDETALSETMQLSPDEFDGLALTNTVLDEVAQKTERLRARSIAARHLQITGKLKDEAKIVGASILGAGAFRAVSVRLATGKDVWVYPVIGVPTANIMNDIARKAADANQGCPFLVYDEQGLTDQWLEHLAWLNTHIPEVDFMRVSRAGSELKKRA